MIINYYSNKMRQNKTRGTLLSSDYELCADLLDLAVRVFRQTLTAREDETGGLVDITQMVPLDTTQVESYV